MSVRLKIGVLAGALVALVGGIVWLAHVQTVRMGVLAADIYDAAVPGSALAADAGQDLMRLHAARPDAVRPALQAIADHLAASQMLAVTPRTRDAAAGARAAVLAVTGGSDAPRMAAADAAIRSLGRSFGADALQLRDRAMPQAAGGLPALLLGLAAIVGLTIASAWLLLRAVLAPLGQATAVVQAMADGQLDIAIAAGGTDEAGRLLAALGRMQAAVADNMAALQDRHAQDLAAAEQAADRAGTLAHTTLRFERDMGDALDGLASAASSLRGASGEMSGAAEDTSGRAAAVAAAAGETACVVQTVAAATEELAASIREVGSRVDRATQIIGSAVSQAQDTDHTVQGLTAAAEKIGAIVDVIRRIAAQTNLLALNATIEAARAGDAGRGFAVVANEVKALANQTARATDEIAAQIGTMQVETGHAATAIRGIAETINDVNALSLAIATAMEQQGQATAEIARSIVTAASGTGQVSSNIDSVTQAAGNLYGSAGQVLAAATALSGQSNRLRADVSRFLDEVRAA